MGCFSMNRVDAFHKLKNHPKLKRYYKLSFHFLDYLSQKENMEIHIEAYDKKREDIVYISKPYMRRWSPNI